MDTGGVVLDIYRGVESSLYNDCGWSSTSRDRSKQRAKRSIERSAGGLPLFAFAIFSPILHRASDKFGAEKTIFVSLLALTAGTLIRSYGGPGGCGSEPW
jgi:hypothetical protein